MPTPVRASYIFHFLLFSKVIPLFFSLFTISIYLVAFLSPHKALVTPYPVIALIFASLLTAGGLFMSVPCLQMAVRPFFLRIYGVRTHGTVIRRAIEPDISQIPSVVVEVEFFAPPGSHKTWFYYRDFPVGSAVPLLYNPYKPAHVRLVEPRSRFAEPIDFGMMVFGLALLVPTLWLFVTFLVAF